MLALTELSQTNKEQRPIIANLSASVLKHETKGRYCHLLSFSEQGHTLNCSLAIELNCVFLFIY